MSAHLTTTLQIDLTKVLDLEDASGFTIDVPEYGALTIYVVAQRNPYSDDSEPELYCTILAKSTDGRAHTVRFDLDPAKVPA